MNTINPPHPMKWHPACEIFPMMGEKELASLTKDIHLRGQQETIKVLNGLNGVGIDGRNRYAACLANSMEPRLEAVALPPGMLVSDFVWSLNAERRHLTEAQRAAAGARLVVAMREEETEIKTSPPTPVAELKKKAAAKTGATVTSIERAEAAEKARPGAMKEIESGAATLRGATPKAKARPLEAPPPPQAPAAKPKLVDGLERELPAKFGNIFRALNKFAAARKACRAVAAALSDLAESEAAAFLPLQRVKADLKNVQMAIDDNEPHAPCVHCGGDGLVRGSTCGGCDGNGWLSASRYKSAPESKKKDYAKEHGHDTW